MKPGAKNVEVRKTVQPFRGLAPVFLLYSSGEYSQTDSQTLVYTMRKLSVLLTDDLAAVIGNDVYNTVRGDFFVFDPSELHHGRFLRAGLHRYLDVYFPIGWGAEKLVYADRASVLFHPFPENRKRMNLVRPDDEKRAELLAIAERLAALAEARPTPDDHTADMSFFASMLELIDVCAQAYAQKETAPPVAPVPPVVRMTVRYINENYAEDVNLSRLADVAGCSVTYLARVFRAHTGRTVHGYLTERRVAAAEKLLLDGKTVTEACYGAGFGDCSHFIRVFRRLTGRTPGKYGRE